LHDHQHGVLLGRCHVDFPPLKLVLSSQAN
jgi:hypothetical protein